MRIRILVTVVAFALGIGAMFFVTNRYGGMLGITVGMLIIVMGLTVWTLPAASFERGNPMDRGQRRAIGLFLGTGLGMIGGLVVASLVPPPLNWLALGAVLFGVMIWWFFRK